MPESRKKLLLIDGSWPAPTGGPGGGVDIVAIMRALDGQVEIVRTSAGGEGVVDALRDQSIVGVLAPAGDFLPFHRQMVQLQSAALLNALGEGVCLADADGQILWSNGEFAGYSPQTRARIGAVCRQAAKSIAETAGSAGAEAEGQRRRFDVAADGVSTGGPGPAGGESQWLEVMVSPVPSGGPMASPGGMTRVIAVVRDVTTARRRQMKMDLIDRAGSALVNIDADEVRKLRTTERLRVLEQKIVRHAHDLLHFDHFAVRLLDEKSGKLELVMSQGLPPEALEVELFARPDNNGISGYVAATGRSYICSDTTRDPRYVTGIKSARSSLTVPLRLSDKVIGIFNVESTHPGAFGEEDRQFAEMFCTHVALALHILDLLVVERCVVGQAVTGNVEGELNEPLEDIQHIVAKLKESIEKAGADGANAAGAPNGAASLATASAAQLQRILADVDAIRRRVKDVAQGPGTILGAEKALTDAALDPAIAGRRVLVADDDARIRQTIRQLLSSLGAEVVVCENGTTAIAALTGVGAATGGPAGSGGANAGPGQERSGAPSPGHAAGGAPSGGQTRPFDLLISDIKMPDATGYEIFAAARKVLPDLPVILMTGFGYDPHHSIVRASEDGLQCVLFKPFHAERLIEEVHKAMAKS